MTILKEIISKEQRPDNLMSGKCGIIVTLVGPSGERLIRQSCKMWNCPECREQRIVDCIKKICDKLANLPCVHVFVAYRKEKGTALSNFTKRNIRGQYCRVNGIDTSVIISDRKFADAARCDKMKFLEHTLPEILHQPWWKGKRISFSKRWNKTEVEISDSAGTKTESGYWGMVVGDVRDEYSKLCSDAERKSLFQKQIKLRIFRAGKKFLAA